MKKPEIALLSVSVKEGGGYLDIVTFARALLEEFSFKKIIASGGTAAHLRKHGIPVTDASEFIGKFVRECLKEAGLPIPPKLDALLGQPFLDNRVSTMSQEIMGAIISKDTPEHSQQLAERWIERVDLVCYDYYPLEAEIARPGSTLESVIEKTDIGGPVACRAAAKGNRITICVPEDREKYIEWARKGMPDYDGFINSQAAKAELIVSRYVAASAMYRSGGAYDAVFGMKVVGDIKGENGPQGPATFYATDDKDPLAHSQFKQIVGNAMGFVNRTDLDRLLQTITHAAAIFEVNTGQVPFLAFGVKHGNCCGGAYGDNSVEVLKKMIDGDRQAIFGGFIMTNFRIGPEQAQVLLWHGVKPGGKARKIDGIVCPYFPPDAIAALKNESGTRRLIENEAVGHLGLDSLDKAPIRREVRGGYLKQKGYTYIPDLSPKNPSLKLYGGYVGMNIDDLLLAGAICATSNSNTITLVKNGMLIGNGAGQQSRVRAARLALDNATDSGHDPKGSVAWSDSFFPFPDGPDTLIQAGIKVIFATSGSQKDELTIEHCMKAGIALLMLPDSEARGFFNH